ncbi:hypothetical protein CGQ11_22515 [Pseudomonas aeruginosa]|nr:hypothetical protein CSC41_1148 [Pseudomonas aeruginosa]KAB0692409.1 hypothetical protein F7O89_20795 [Pseudomonas aeruginosa]MBK3902844.1 hypothetical protein [Pseudomonas aeruginosa]MCO2251332.1 hypothetical protein [Pseudomonas aeruginosa]MCO2260394.1 hypothetical protein [Pseudomonas aeruginosa]
MTEGAPVRFGTHDHANQCAHRRASLKCAVRRVRNQQATLRRGAWLVLGRAGGQCRFEGGAVYRKGRPGARRGLPSVPFFRAMAGNLPQLNARLPRAARLVVAARSEGAAAAPVPQPVAVPVKDAATGAQPRPRR